ncbi:MAG: hypothetical protein ACOC3D_13570 [Pseudomonadota bacterium]
MSDQPINPVEQFRQLANDGERIAEALHQNGAPNQAQVVAALAHIVRQVADQLEAQPNGPA